MEGRNTRLRLTTTPARALLRCDFHALFLSSPFSYHCHRRSLLYHSPALHHRSTTRPHPARPHSRHSIKCETCGCLTLLMVVTSPPQTLELAPLSPLTPSSHRLLYSMRICTLPSYISNFLHPSRLLCKLCAPATATNICFCT